MGQQKTREENRVRYEAGFKKKYRFLKKSCEIFDAGNQDEADRIASELVNFCHSGSASSILANLNASKKAIYTDTSGELPGSGLMSDWHPFVMMELGGGSFDFKPLLAEHGQLIRYVKLDTWWKGPVLRKYFPNLKFDTVRSALEENIIINMLRFYPNTKKKQLIELLQNRKLYSHFSYSRSDIALAVRNSEGAHYLASPAKITIDFGDLDDQPYVAECSSGELRPQTSMLNATIRHMAYELIETLESNFNALTAAS